ncbi:MAG: anaerobic ribonucleoside-triphosphate reductase activating protein [Dethiobacter sp.]|jgi:pyruvate formate lyase activating enzyme|nr:MAG: anaerobic ribonucleoside-triphosphate reductase activating protein [Dethiobacter sp.]
MDIRGLQKISLIDFPGGICSTIFVGGCNLTCRFCYNKDLVLNPEALPLISTGEVFNFLKVKASLLDGICISGGEPTLQEDLPDFLVEIKKLGLKVKLDTNGTKPEVICKLLEENILDYIAVDIKGPLPKYSFIAGNNVNLSKVQETITLLKDNPLQQEFRTTVIPGLLKEEDIFSIAEEIAGCRRYVLQQFHPKQTMIDPELLSFKPFSREKVAEIACSCREYVEKVQLRGF